MQQRGSRTNRSIALQKAVARVVAGVKPTARVRFAIYIASLLTLHNIPAHSYGHGVEVFLQQHQGGAESAAETKLIVMVRAEVDSFGKRGFDPVLVYTRLGIQYLS